MSEQREQYSANIEAMPPGLERAILRVLEPYTAIRTISRGDLVYNCGRIGFPASERQVREIIKRLRRQGHLICSTAQEGGYYMARSKSEYAEFRAREYFAKIKDMSETMSAMDAAAREQFGDGYQLGFEGVK